MAKNEKRAICYFYSFAVCILIFYKYPRVCRFILAKIGFGLYDLRFKNDDGRRKTRIVKSV